MGFGWSGAAAYCLSRMLSDVDKGLISEEKEDIKLFSREYHG